MEVGDIHSPSFVHWCNPRHGLPLGEVCCLYLSTVLSSMLVIVYWFESKPVRHSKSELQFNWKIKIWAIKRVSESGYSLLFNVVIAVQLNGGG